MCDLEPFSEIQSQLIMTYIMTVLAVIGLNNEDQYLTWYNVILENSPFKIFNSKSFNQKKFRL